MFALKFKACGRALFGGDRRQAGFSIQKKEKSKKYSDRLPHRAFLFSPNSLNKFGLVEWSVAYAT
ncbi:hypothetical protein N9X39_05850 [Alphaproteobacteria bacterium]|nr:hypothetical protein [Alphaproteobacteria bacterium]